MTSPLSSARVPAETPPESEARLETHPDLLGSAPQHKPDAAPCCVGIDHPGLGFVHADDCPVAPGYATQSPSPTQPVPEPLRSFVSDPSCKADAEFFGAGLRALIAEIDTALLARREGLFGQLLFAARDVAEDQLVSVHVGIESAIELQTFLAHCRECRMTEHLGKLLHTPSCKTGRVLDLIRQLMNTYEIEEKEAAPDAGGPADRSRSVGSQGAKDCTDDGIRPCGLKDRWCAQCGERNGEWDAEQRPESEVELETLKLNQCVGIGSGGRGHTLYTHRCWKDSDQGSVASDQLKAAKSGTDDGIPSREDFGEPWRLQTIKGRGGEAFDLLERDGECIFGFSCMDGRQKAQLSRIIDCVNAVAGIAEPGKVGAR